MTFVNSILANSYPPQVFLSFYGKSWQYTEGCQAAELSAFGLCCHESTCDLTVSVTAVSAYLMCFACDACE